MTLRELYDSIRDRENAYNYSDNYTYGIWARDWERQDIVYADPYFCVSALYDCVPKNEKAFGFFGFGGLAPAGYDPREDTGGYSSWPGVDFDLNIYTTLEERTAYFKALQTSVWDYLFDYEELKDPDNPFVWFTNEDNATIVGTKYTLLRYCWECPAIPKFVSRLVPQFSSNAAIGLAHVLASGDLFDDFYNYNPGHGLVQNGNFLNFQHISKQLKTFLIAPPLKRTTQLHIHVLHSTSPSITLHPQTPVSAVLDLMAP